LKVDSSERFVDGRSGFEERTPNAEYRTPNAEHRSERSTINANGRPDLTRQAPLVM
jgi:hypothetical protein